MNVEDMTIGMEVRVSPLNHGREFIGRVTVIHTEPRHFVGGSVDEPNGIVRLEVTEKMASHWPVGQLVDVGAMVCWPV